MKNKEKKRLIISIVLNVFLVVTATFSLMFINKQRIFGISILILASSSLFLWKDKRNKVLLYSVIVFTSIISIIINQYLFLTINGIITIILSYIILFINIYYLFHIFNLKYRLLKFLSCFLSATLLGILLVCSLILMITSITPVPYISYMQREVMHDTNNDFIKENIETKVGNDITRISNIKYSNNYARSYFDIYYTNKEIINPKTVIYFHSGGYVWGDKEKGDPFSSIDGTRKYYQNFLEAGYNLVCFNYALAPEYNYPTPLYQVSEGMKYLIDNGNTFGINVDEFIFAGVSAGGHLVGQFVLLQTNQSYAKAIDIDSVIEKDKIKAVVFSSALLDFKRYAKTVSYYNDWNYFQSGRAYIRVFDLFKNRKLNELNIIENIFNDFPPTFISDGNTGTFLEQAKDLNEKLNSLGIINQLHYYSKKEVSLPHAFETDGGYYAHETLSEMRVFLNKIT